MLARRAFFYWQFAAAAVLPAWLLLGWALWGSSGSFAGIALATPFLVLALLAVAGFTVARRSVRDARAVSWLDLGVAGAWHVLVIALGFFGPWSSIFAALSVAVGIVAFWSTAWQLVAETRKRVRSVFASLERAARPPGSPGAQAPVNRGEYIVLPPSQTPPPSR
ncbi:MAG: hypothetical protein JWR33_1904 [Naasia sp.]|jgi:hypothetical protein|uniref:hypothetical protein n=1 Tax=Naasia sp. TaxID=2546198 RepID=UPI002639C6B0|nr:hypothetical protein [Naasia sp.]MCU1571163.1 hypothetical protein [Naasia sp.]